MNANELADLIGMCGDGGYNQDAATMLRQQQAEIEALKQIIDANNLSQNIGQFVKPTNETVAEKTSNNGWNVSQKYMDLPIGTLLYTHPVKELSETRIKQIFVEQTGFYFDDNPADDLALMDFAKALLLEAQEK